ncbi:hypothetical protein GOB93_13515 [Acetobacter musti]|uniref:Uncharacterized protein n=1 Tax=Acetobacter musti TaxID=864732 RepID=A0ABX0JQS4_9PROT|nr:hypothetical protein [Acetobacter musti]NHN85652.1 hypothetical protein [Acetobacter musti]
MTAGRENGEKRQDDNALFLHDRWSFLSRIPVSRQFSVRNPTSAGSTADTLRPLASLPDGSAPCKQPIVWFRSGGRFRGVSEQESLAEALAGLILKTFVNTGYPEELSGTACPAAVADYDTQIVCDRLSAATGQPAYSPRSEAVG